MKITQIETYPVWGGYRNFLFVVIDTDEGIYGVGEAGITGRELAVIGAIEVFDPYVFGKHFTLITDAQNITWLKSVSAEKSKLGRWAMMFWAA